MPNQHGIATVMRPCSVRGAAFNHNFKAIARREERTLPRRNRAARYSWPSVQTIDSAHGLPNPRAIKGAVFDHALAAGAAGILGVTMSQLSRLIRHERHAFAKVNEGREACGLTRLRS